MPIEKKTVFTLNVNGFNPEITDLTYPLLKHYAKRIGADFYEITERRFPGWPVTYEKLQIYELAQQMDNDWNIFFDADALIHPETIDFTQYINKGTVAHNGSDMAAIRWTYDRFFKRDGRNIGSCNWCTIGSDWCIELWKPLDDLTFDEAVKNIQPTIEEKVTVITPDHLIDDYVLSRNIAKYGLKFTTLRQLLSSIGLSEANFFWHTYTVSSEQKVIDMKATLNRWRLG